MPSNRKKTTTPESDDNSILKTTAEAIGSALGTLAAKTGLASGEPVTPAAAPKAGKLQKKDKHRLPRKAKKELSKQRSARAA